MNCHSFNTEKLSFGTLVHWKIAINYFSVFQNELPWQLLEKYKGFPHGFSGKEPPCQMQEMQIQSLCWEDPLEEGFPWKPIQVFLPQEYQGQRAWWATAHRVAKSQIQLKGFRMHMYTHMKQYKR